jgi:hypothetical protein
VVVGQSTDVIGGHVIQEAGYVFKEPSTGWTDMTQTAKLTASDGVVGDVVSISGDTVVVGGGGAAAAYVFAEPASGWSGNMTQTAELTAPDVFGSVSIVDNMVVVGAPGASVGGTNRQGAAYVYTEPTSGWRNMTQTAKLTPSDGAASDYFGSAVSIDGNNVLVGADGSVAAYMFGAAAAGGILSVTPPGSQTATAGQSRSFALGRFSENGATGPYSIDINWGDGSAHTRFTQKSAGTITGQSHKFDKAATDTVRVMVTDAKGHKSNTSAFAFTIKAAAPAKLAFMRQPTTTVAGQPVTPAVTVEVLDQYGNIVTSNNSKVTLSMGTHVAKATLSGTLTMAAAGGVSTFSNLSLNKPGTYTLKAADGKLTAAVSKSFRINVGAPAKLVFAGQPGSATVGKLISPAILVYVEDALGNLVTTDKSAVTLALASNPAGAKLQGTVTINAKAGVATFSKVSISAAGSYTLQATDGALTAATSGSIVVNAVKAAAMIFAQHPTIVAEQPEVLDGVARPI